MRFWNPLRVIGLVLVIVGLAIGGIVSLHERQVARRDAEAAWRYAAQLAGAQMKTAARLAVLPLADQFAISLDGDTTTLRWTMTAHADAGNLRSVTLTKALLGGVGPAEPLPMQIATPAPGQSATTVLHYPHVPWKRDGSDMPYTNYGASFDYHLDYQRPLPQGNTSSGNVDYHGIPLQLDKETVRRLEDQRKKQPGA